MEQKHQATKLTGSDSPPLIGPLSEAQWTYTRSFVAENTNLPIGAGNELIRFVAVMAYANGASDLFDPAKFAAADAALAQAKSELEALSQKLDAYVHSHPHRPPAALSGEGRTDAEVVAKTEELARALAEHDGYILEAGTFRLSANPKVTKFWNLACVAQEILTCTDPNDAAENLEDEVQEDSCGSATLGNEPLPIYYMRDNHTFKVLSEDVDEAIAQIIDEIAGGYSSGSVCSKRPGAPSMLHFRVNKTAEALVELRSWYKQLNAVESNQVRG